MPGNKWSKFVFTIYSPIYDLVGNLFNKHREIAIHSLELKPGDRVLLDGGGTGIDLKYLPDFIEIHISDITPAMMAKARKKAARYNLNPKFHLTDSMQLNFPDNHFDAILLHFIVAVVPDHLACLKEAKRVLKQEGKISLMDKFLPPGKKESVVRRLLNPLAKLFFSNISIDPLQLIQNTGLTVLEDHAFFPGHNFRRFLLTKATKT